MSTTTTTPNDARRGGPAAGGTGITLWTAEHQRTRTLVRRQKHPTKPPPPVPFPCASLQIIDSAIGRIHPITMNKDAVHNATHFHRARDADLFEQFCRDRLPADDIYVPAAHQPLNPEDEDDVVPDQHAAFGIQKATMAKREPAWRDLGLGDLMGKGPEAGVWKGVGRGGGGAGAVVKKTVLPR